MMNKKIMTYAIVGLLIISGMIALFFSGFIPLTTIDYHTGIHPDDINNCNTQKKWSDVWKGMGNPSLPGEMFGSGYDRYITARSPQDEHVSSELITVHGHIAENSLWETSHPKYGWFEVFITEDGQNWKRIIWDGDVDDSYVAEATGINRQYVEAQIWQVGDWFTFTMDSLEFKLKGAHVGALRTELHFHFEYWFDSWNAIMSKDWAYLLSGSGKVTVSGYSKWETPQFEIGDVVNFKIEADYSGASEADNGQWELWAHPKDTSLDAIRITTFDDWTRTTYPWTIPTNLWYRGIPDSRVEIWLKNTLFDVDYVEICTIDLKANAPPTPEVVVTPQNPKVGEKVLVEMTAYTNQYTHEEVDYFIAEVVYINNGEKLYDSYITGVGQDPSEAQFEFTPYRQGDFMVKVWAHDVAGRMSEIHETVTGHAQQGSYTIEFTVYDKDTSQPLSGVKVKTGSTEKISDSDGEATFSLDRGFYTFSFYKAGYRSETEGFKIEKDMKEVMFLQQTQMLFDLNVTVKTSDGAVVPFAIVKVGSATQGSTKEDGTIQFEDLPEGDYEVSAERKGMTGSKNIELYGDTQIEITISKGGDVQETEFGYMGLILGFAVISIFMVIAVYFKRYLPFGKYSQVLIMVIGLAIGIVLMFLL